MNTSEYVVSSILPADHHKIKKPRWIVSLVVILTAFALSSVCLYVIARGIVGKIYDDVCKIVENLDDFQLQGGKLTLAGEDSAVQIGDIWIFISDSVSHQDAQLDGYSSYLFIGPTQAVVMFGDTGYAASYRELEESWGSLDFSKELLQSYVSEQNKYYATNLVTSTFVLLFFLFAPLKLLEMLLLQLIYALLCKLFHRSIAFPQRFCNACGCAAIPTLLFGLAMLAFCELGNIGACTLIFGAAYVLLVIVFALLSILFYKKGEAQLSAAAE